MDQQGCSSPQVIFWLGKKDKNMIKIFWKILSDIVSKNYNFDYSLAVRKTELASDIILKEGYVAIQAESHPTQFRAIELLPLTKTE